MRISDWSSDVCAAELELSRKSSEAKLRSVLVPEPHALGMLAAIRSLGRAGYRVHAASPRPDAIGFLSRYCTTRPPCPQIGRAACRERECQYAWIAVVVVP